MPRFCVVMLALGGVLLIQAPAGAEEKMVLRTYEVGHLLDVRSTGDTSHDALIRRILRAGPAQSWAANGGKGTVQYYPLGLVIVVHQGPSVHKRIQAVLDRMHEHRQAQNPKKGPGNKN